MHSKKILGIIASVLIFLTPSFIFGQKTKGKATLSVKQEVDILMTNLKKNLKQKDSPKATAASKFEKVEKTLKEITALRKKNARQLENDELAMDILVSGLVMLPKSNDFKKSECPNYKQKIVQDLSPSPNEEVDPQTQSTLDVLNLICR